MNSFLEQPFCGSPTLPTPTTTVKCMVTGRAALVAFALEA